MVFQKRIRGIAICSPSACSELSTTEDVRASKTIGAPLLTKYVHRSSTVLARVGTRLKACRCDRRSVSSQGCGTLRKSPMKSRTGIGPRVYVFESSTAFLFLALTNSGPIPLVRVSDSSNAMGTLYGGRSSGGVWRSCMVQRRECRSLEPPQKATGTSARSEVGPMPGVGSDRATYAIELRDR